MSNASRVPRWSTARLLLFGLAVAAVVSGCTSGDPKTYPLKGKVVFKGGLPVTGGSIAFESTSGDPPWRAGGQIEPDGTFTSVSTLGPDGKELKGLVGGTHRVRIDLGRGGDRGEDASKVSVPARYLSFEKSNLTVQIPAPNDEVTIELEPK
jgi:hypothetical protein